MSVEEINEIKKTLRLNFFKLVEKMSKMTNTKLKSIMTISDFSEKRIIYYENKIIITEKNNSYYANEGQCSSNCRLN